MYKFNLRESTFFYLFSIWKSKLVFGPTHWQTLLWLRIICFSWIRYYRVYKFDTKQSFFSGRDFKKHKSVSFNDFDLIMQLYTHIIIWVFLNFKRKIEYYNSALAAREKKIIWHDGWLLISNESSLHWIQMCACPIFLIPLRLSYLKIKLYST